MMLARTLKWSILLVALCLTGWIGFSSLAPSAQAATDLDTDGTVTIKASYMFKDVEWTVEGIPYALGKQFFFNFEIDGFVIGGDYIATDGTLTQAGRGEFMKSPYFNELFRAYLEKYLVNYEDYKAGSPQVQEAVSTAVVVQPKFRGLTVSGTGVSENQEPLDEVAVGTPSDRNGYPAIYRLKGMKAKPYKVRLDDSFTSKNLWPLSSRFIMWSTRYFPVERQVDKYGKDLYPFFQVLRADGLVPGTQVVDKSTPREIRGMIGAGKSGEGADALYTMNAWVALAQSKGVPVDIVGRSVPSVPPVSTPSTASSGPSKASASPTVTPSVMSPSASPSVVPQGSESTPSGSAPVEQDHSPNLIVWFVAGSLIFVIGIVLVAVWRLRSRRKQMATEEDATLEE